ncbi:hypothetical protein AMJ80_08630 [bacterium SM23_31]|nr:MAG: hypothetical protein AMJ80_08630 [bacterium SM23_31]
MKISFLHEPELEFGTGRHIDIRFGLINYGPLDFDSPSAPKNINLGIVGNLQTVEGVHNWLELCRNGIAAKVSKQPNLFPKFPGFEHDKNFYSQLILDDSLNRSITNREFDSLCDISNSSEIIKEAVNIFWNEFEYLSQNKNVNVILCAVPLNLLNKMEEGIAKDTEDVVSDPAREIRLDFHDLLKARVMELKIPTQVILPMTWDKHSRQKQKRRPEKIKQLQDEATRAWNIHTALYYKAGGKPWRLIREPSMLTSCYIGISFYKSIDDSKLFTSVAQIFNERGEGIIVRGAVANISKEDLHPHLNDSDAYNLLNDALEKYRAEHRTFPARIVLHKSSSFNNEEINGFRQSAESQSIELYDFISLKSSFTRLFRGGAYPPLRGTILSLDNKTHILYTKGGIDFYSTYPGMYVPRTLEFHCDLTDQTPKFLAEEILSLTKMNWNNTQFDGFEPITLRAARQVGSILKYIDSDKLIEPRYSFYM